METITVIKSNNFKLGQCSVRRILIDKERSVAFEQGDFIEVTEDEFDKLKHWAIRVNEDGSLYEK